MLKKARKHKNGGDRNILDRWNNDDKHRKSLSDIGWTEERIIQYDENRTGRPFLRGNTTRKKSVREIVETFFECRRYSRATESAQ